MIDYDDQDILREQHRGYGPIHKILKLPCGHESVEIDKPEDQWVHCSTCHKDFRLVWSNNKIEGPNE